MEVKVKEITVSFPTNPKSILLIKIYSTVIEQRLPINVFIIVFNYYFSFYLLISNSWEMVGLTIQYLHSIGVLEGLNNF